jgi:hypothetical protein
MSDEKISKLYGESAESGRQFTYFLLAAAGAAIGFSVQVTQGKALSYSHFLLGAAVLFWSASFYAGCRKLDTSHNIVVRNIKYLQICTDMARNLAEGDAAAVKLKNTMQGDLQKDGEKSAKWANYQVGLFYTGGIAFVFWHVVQMYFNK